VNTLPVFGLTVLWILGVWLGFILLVVPGLILMTMWSLCIPVLVSGEAGVMGSFGRSRALTKGARLKIFALLLLLMVIYYALTAMMMGSVFTASGPGNVAGAMTAAMAPAILAGSLIVATVFMFLLPALLAATYIEAVHVQFGSRDGSVAEVFS